MYQDVNWYGDRLGPGDIVIVLGGDPAPPKKRHSSLPQFSAHALWPNGWMDQDAIWYGGIAGLGPGHTVLDGDPALLKGHSSPIFGPYLLWLNGWMD